MGCTKIDVGAIVGLSNQISSSKNTVSDVRDSVNAIRGQIDGRILGRNNLSARFSSATSQLMNIESRIGSVKMTTENGANSYMQTDRTVVAWKNEMIGNINSISQDAHGSGVGSVTKTDTKEKSGLWSWDDTWNAVDQFGIVGSAISSVGSAITGATTAESSLNGIKGSIKVAEKIADGLSDSKTGFDWKRLVGFEKAIKQDTPKKFREALKESFDDLSFGKAKEVSKKVSVGAKWAGHALTAITTTYENFTDTEENNSTGRKIAESIGETTVKIGTDIAVGAAVTAGLAAVGVVGAPVVVVGAITVGVTWAVDKVFEATTGKDMAECLSDLVLDTGSKVVDGVGKAAKKVTGAISGWWNKTFG